MRVLMTGGYGCIGTWIAKKLCEAGERVWIFDLKEDTHRLDLVLDEKHKSAITFLQGDVSDVDALRRPSLRCRQLISFISQACKPPPAGPTRSWGEGQRHRYPRRVRGRARP